MSALHITKATESTRALQCLVFICKLFCLCGLYSYDDY